MGKRKGFKKSKNPVDALADAASSDDELEGKLEDLLDDEIEKYNSTKEKDLLNKSGKNKKQKRKHDDSDEEQEVYGLDLDDSEDDEEAIEDEESDSESEDNDDDILGEKEYDGVPDSRAWGKQARLYHNTDYIDQDFGGFEGQDAELAAQEETEAKEIQKRLTAELDESDFLGFLPSKQEKSKKMEKTKEVFKLDVTSMSLQDKRKLVQRQCPEIIHMLDEYKEKICLTKTLLEKVQEEPSEFLKEFYKTKYHIILNYCINISYYLYLHSTKPESCKGHPVIKRILQFKRLMDELSQFDPDKFVAAPKPKKRVKLMPKLKPKSILKKANGLPTSDSMEEVLSKQKVEVIDPAENVELEKRRITYEMKKNKGLTPHRKKEQRNPRVKHKEKFRKAKIRRRGQVRTPRTEVQRYGGELTGIKSHVTKSIKLK